MITLKNIFSRKGLLPLLLLTFLLFSSALAYHHGWSNYDEDKPLNLTGEILEAAYENPHGIIKLKTKDKTWTVVLAPPSRMENRGLTRDILKVGSTATVVGYPHKEEKGEMRAERITIGEKSTELR